MGEKQKPGVPAGITWAHLGHFSRDVRSIWETFIEDLRMLLSGHLRHITGSWAMCLGRG